jgi:NAD-dependent dihydropyrimidine dehydrogenase PreA subunit
VIFGSADVSHVDHFGSYRCSVDGICIDMCGRYSLGLSNEEVYDGLEARLPQLFEQGRPRWEREQDHRPRYDTSTSAHAELRIGIM